MARKAEKPKKALKGVNIKHCNRNYQAEYQDQIFALLIKRGACQYKRK